MELDAPGIQEWICLILDEESLHSALNDGPHDVHEFQADLARVKSLGLRRPLPFIKAVDRNLEPPPDGKRGRYPGWMKASLVSLGRNLYPKSEFMRYECPDWFPGLGAEWFEVYEQERPIFGG